MLQEFKITWDKDKLNSQILRTDNISSANFFSFLMKSPHIITLNLQSMNVLALKNEYRSPIKKLYLKSEGKMKGKTAEDRSENKVGSTRRSSIQYEYIKGVELKIFNEQQESFLVKIKNNDSLDDDKEKYNFKSDIADSNYMRYYKDNDFSATPEMIHVQTKLNKILAR